MITSNLELPSDYFFKNDFRMKETEVYNYLIENDDDFDPKLSGRVELSAYAKKLTDNATFSGFFFNENLIAIVIAYTDSDFAYIPYIHVKKEHRGKNLASELLSEFISDMKIQGKKSIKLTVKKDSKAHKLYMKKGFNSVASFVYQESDITGLELELIL